jgi:type I restriction enzyme R subunit
MTEDQLEQVAIEWFRVQGYEYACGPDIGHDGDSPERPDYASVILPRRLASSLSSLNPAIPASVIDEVVSLLQKPKHLTLLANNRQFHEWLLDGVPVEVEKNGRKIGDRVKLIDFSSPEKNHFLVVNQYTIFGTKQPRRPDIVVCINGLPIAVIELKNPADEQADIWAAFHQLQTYKQEISDLFIFNEILVISDGINARLGSLTADQERFMRWRTLKNQNDKPLLEFELETLVRGFFDRELLLDYLRYFVLFENTGETLIKKIAGYHQFHAVREAVKATIVASYHDADSVAEPRNDWARRVTPGCKKGGVVWHTQGVGEKYFHGLLCRETPATARDEKSNTSDCY